MTAALQALDRPRRLVPGDTVAVVAPSGHVDPDRLARGCAVLKSWGLSVVTGAHALDRAGHLAGLDEDRADDLQRAWCDTSVAAILCARGGSGAARLLDLLDWEELREAGPKVFIGYSDATALHEALATHLGLVTLFGPMPASATFGGDRPDTESLDHLRRTLFAPQDALELGGDDATCVTAGRASGVTVGGTLSVLSGSLGTPESRPATGGIAVIEDVAEPTYRLDALLTHLLRARWFDGVRGIVLGTWVDCGEDAQEVVCSRLLSLDVPVLAGLPFGHGVPQLTVPLGVPAELDADAGTLTLAVPALA
jgi:muramoyltetrapeptide carboxypeptidase